MKNCGRRFHNEVGKFRFLNELVKVISPKVRNKSGHTDKSECLNWCLVSLEDWLISFVVVQHLGDKVSERVKTKVITMLYSWTVSLPDEAKISEAYHMLKLQGERDNPSTNSSDKLAAQQKESVRDSDF